MGLESLKVNKEGQIIRKEKVFLEHSISMHLLNSKCKYEIKKVRI